MGNKKNNSNTGIIILIICAVITIALIVGCVFFPEQLFGIFK